VECSRVSGSDSVVLMLSAMGRGFVVNFGMGGNTIVGIGHVNGKAEGENASTVRLPSVLSPGATHSIIVQVRRDHVAAYVDGKLVTQYKTDYSDLSMPPIYEIGPNLLGLGTYSSPTLFSVIEVTEVTGSAGR